MIFQRTKGNQMNLEDKIAEQGRKIAELEEALVIHARGITTLCMTLMKLAEIVGVDLGQVDGSDRGEQYYTDWADKLPRN